MEPVAREIGAGFDVMLDTVNGFEPEILALRLDGRDPILYFYENFLETFDHKARERFGVYYTPVQVVRYMVGALDRALRQSLGTAGLADENVHILDPATGTGTYLLGIADRLRRDVARREGPGQTPPAIRGLAARMYGFELLVGPYAVAHYRLHHALSRNLEGAPKVTGLPRLGVYLTDTLARPGSAAPLGPLGFVSEGIRDERLESNRIKTEQPILAIIGNPPYRRLEAGENETLVGQWMDDLWDDLKEPVRDAGQGNQLNTFPELSVAFWRWAIWKLFEAENAPRRGVVAFITNRKFLTGWPYAGLRKMMRERFDRIEIIDLRGDVRRGERAGVGADQGVFNIQVGTAITLAIADGRKAPDALAAVRYNDAWAHDYLSRRDKFAWLVDGEDDGALYGEVAVDRGPLEDFRPSPFLNGDLLGIGDCFQFQLSGVQSKRDAFVYAVDQSALQSRISTFVSGTPNSSIPTFGATSARPEAVARAQPFDILRVGLVSYRPLDRRYLYNHSKYLDRPRPELQLVWGDENVSLYAMPAGTGEGPAVWCHGLLPDYHAFRGSYGGYAFPLFDRRLGHGPYNVKADLMEALGAAYGGAVTPEAVFDAILCLLSARSYTTRFAEDLEDTFPHIPFPAARTLFEEAAAFGAEIRAVETFSRLPRVQRALGRAETAPTGPLAPVEWVSGEIRLCADGSGHISHIPAAVWEFAVSGYRLLPRWLAAREGLAIGPTFIPELRDVAAADSILVRTLDAPLSRAALGLKVRGAS
jgi:predicted helicase